MSIKWYGTKHMKISMKLESNLLLFSQIQKIHHDNYRISLIFWPPRPIIHPIRSLGIVISWVCTLWGWWWWWWGAKGGGGGGGTAAWWCAAGCWCAWRMPGWCIGAAGRFVFRCCCCCCWVAANMAACCAAAKATVFVVVGVTAAVSVVGDVPFVCVGVWPFVDGVTGCGDDCCVCCECCCCCGDVPPPPTGGGGVCWLWCRRLALFYVLWLLLDLFDIDMYFFKSIRGFNHK